MIILNSDNVNLIFDAEGGSLKSLKYREKEYIGATVPLFLVALRDSDGKQMRTSTFDMRLKEYKASENAISATYENDICSVKVSIQMGTQLSFGIEISKTGENTVEWVNYPQIAVPDDFRDNGGSSKILWGFNEGTLIDDITAREENLAYFEPEYPCKGIMGVYPAIVETQFMKQKLIIPKTVDIFFL